MKWMKEFTPLELYVRLPITIGGLITVGYLLWNNLWISLIFLVGAATWENILFILHRLNIIDLKSWKSKPNQP